ncbi:hypothetical protein A2572_00335 [Candidatus Collierbacteria bacterium RIFOXYD1_FULL_40_9]|uniref:Gcp-like domain-containing protein n=1 Tax=Candidatus Collierbacteria bacterium RIFOXYD1_FULL_40_9 TaxID=1817731 RepID=A0A1F5FUI4_9BACT|nr:MAG: hypothetical protein A2572_00335 [Candidatus Collierbacteria bacterium RIFOXYD1_FULL_40_9]
MNLYLDSTNNQKTILRLDDKEFTQEVSSPREQNILGFIQKTLSDIGKTPKDITSIEVNPGPGSFTGTRVGVAIANALGFSLGLSVNRQKEPVEVVYSIPPNITIPK